MTARLTSSDFLLGLLLVGIQTASPPNPVGPTAIPAAVATFGRRYAADDDATMLGIASPLFRLELGRRGVTMPAERADIRPHGLTFTPRGGMWDDEGFGHWFYTTRLAQPTRKAPLSIWRIDSDL